MQRRRYVDKTNRIRLVICTTIVFDMMVSRSSWDTAFANTIILSNFYHPGTFNSRIASARIICQRGAGDKKTNEKSWKTSSKSIHFYKSFSWLPRFMK
ncbi:hypothetical protein VM99_10555 [Pseudomonas chlororaphis]|uniref:Uncharacterized protein n=1 Tax=Pseudomonas chlororaphis TaxID=587753 RepID=A0A0G3GB67_9PSED|nr:hypothetical protein VM99_10555 [Pseudomonas chlororaphis]